MVACPLTQGCPRHGAAGGTGIGGGSALRDPVAQSARSNMRPGLAPSTAFRILSGRVQGGVTLPKSHIPAVEGGSSP